MSNWVKYSVLTLLISMALLCQCVCNASDKKAESANSAQNKIVFNSPLSNGSKQSFHSSSASTTSLPGFVSYQAVNPFIDEQQESNPELVLFTTSAIRASWKGLRSVDQHSIKPIRYDRYKNTIPGVFRLTLKGYSIMEISDNHQKNWTLNKVKNKAFRKPEIMFSFTKQF